MSKNKVSKFQFIQFQRELTSKIKSIPKQNKQKFALDLIALIDLAHQENYNEYHI